MIYGRRILAILGSLAALAVIAYLALWLWLLSADNPLAHPLAGKPAWPVACSTRGCVSSAAWLTMHTLSTNFAQATGQDTPSPEQSLTTTIRAHQVSNAFLKSPVTTTDARRYRENVLNIKNDEKLQEAVEVSTGEYDSTVLLPFLQQEALKVQHKVESTDELYTLLSEERPIVLLLFHFRWNNDTGQALRR